MSDQRMLTPSAGRSMRWLRNLFGNRDCEKKDRILDGVQAVPTARNDEQVPGPALPGITACLKDGSSPDDQSSGISWVAVLA